MHMGMTKIMMGDLDLDLLRDLEKFPVASVRKE